jgi:drug/metabolite transporter (DMT)-like permease
MLALAWMSFAISVGAVALLYFMIRRGAVARVASLFYLVPPVTALIAWPLFGERFSPMGIIGLLLTVVGVALARSSEQ